ncbi:MAG: diguanylate cyclase [Candidatus Eremiobacteraeota bacterium]|nr:diguanylate cyclase [Candidatus Eremiobacteraeota bacterium]
MLSGPVIFGYIAAALVLATFWMRTPVRLRQAAIASNVAFLIYGIWGGLLPLVILHLVLLPLNVWRLVELLQLTKRIKEALTNDLSMDWIRPFMHPRKFVAGEFIFHKGDPQTDVFYVVSGTVRLPEIEVNVNQGELLGEMAIFSPTLERSLSAVCSTDVEALYMPTDNFLKLYYQNPQFGVYLVRLITSRLLQDTHLLGSMINERTDQLERLRSLTDVDEVTGVANRRAFEARLHMEWTRAIRSPAPLSLIVVEIGDRYNRRWTDEWLTQVALALASCASRGSDLLARHGDEFVAILPNTTEEGVKTLANEMRETIESLAVDSAGIWSGDLHCRAGYATRVPDRTIAPEILLEDSYKVLRGQTPTAHVEPQKRETAIKKLVERAFSQEEPLIGG